MADSTSVVYSTFLKRKGGLFKKAHELAVLCSVDVAVIIFGQNKKLYEYSSCDMHDALGRYQYVSQFFVQALRSGANSVVSILESSVPGLEALSKGGQRPFCILGSNFDLIVWSSSRAQRSRRFRRQTR
jgi:hypothetical protein